MFVPSCVYQHTHFEQDWYVVQQCCCYFTVLFSVIPAHSCLCLVISCAVIAKHTVFYFDNCVSKGLNKTYKLLHFLKFTDQVAMQTYFTFFRRNHKILW